MMKLGCMSLSYQQQFKAGKMDLFSFIERAYELRLDGIDIHMRAFASEDPEYLREVRMRCLRRGLAISYLAVSNNFGVAEEALPAQVAMVKEGVDVAAAHGERFRRRRVSLRIPQSMPVTSTAVVTTPMMPAMPVPPSFVLPSTE